MTSELFPVTRRDTYEALSDDERRLIDEMVTLFTQLAPCYHLDGEVFADLPDARLLGQHYEDLFARPNSHLLWSVYNARRMLVYRLFIAL